MKDEKKQDILRLSKSGMTSKQIATELFLDSKTVENYLKRVDLVAKIVTTYINFNMNLTDFELANKCQTNVRFVQNVMSGKECQEIVMKIIDKSTFQEILESRKNRILENRNAFRNTKIFERVLTVEEKRQLDRISQQMTFWFKILFSFRISLEDFAKLVHFNNLEELSKAVYSNAYARNKLYVRALKYLWECHVPAHSNEEEERFKNVKKYLFLLDFAKKQNNKEEYIRLLNQINDQSVIKIKSTKKFQELSEEDIKAVIDFSLKYALPTREWPYEYSNLLKKATPEQLSEYELLKDYNQDIAHRAHSSKKENQGITNRGMW